MVSKLVEFVREEKWRGDAFVTYGDDDVMFEIATHAGGGFKGVAYVEEAEGKVTGLVTAVPLDYQKQVLYVRNILCTTRFAFRQLICVLRTHYPGWTVVAHRANREGKRVLRTIKIKTLTK